MSSGSLRNYEIRQKLGSGSYGVIYKAYSKIDKSTCVLKQISLGRMSEKARKNAANEAHIMGKLKHPFIVCYYQSFVEDNNLNILMEFCDGGDLCYFLKQQNKKYLKQEKIWKFFIQICMGLEHIHKNKILHRDIKTLNIFLHRDETVKIGDLGVAKMLNANDFAHTMVGTPFYLSPELCEEKPYNQKSDIWALGCLLYQLCTFRHPFEATNQASLILKIIRGKYEPIPEFYSKELREMITLCLERDYKRRPTANMILSKPYIKNMIDDFSLNKIVNDYYNKMTSQPPPQQPQQPQPPQQPPKPEPKIVQNKPAITKMQNKAPSVPVERPRKVMDDVAISSRQPVRIEEVKPEVKVMQNVPKDRKPEISQHENLLNKRRDSQPSAKVEREDSKVLFGSENKADFISALQNKMKSPNRIDLQRQQIAKKPAIAFQIPWKGDSQKKIPSEVIQAPKIPNEPQGKIIIHNRNVLIPEAELQNQKSQAVHRVKMEKKVEPKVYQILKPADRPAPIIKSGGFSNHQPRLETGLDRKKIEQEMNKKVESKLSAEKNSQHLKQPQKQVLNSMKNIRKSSEQRPPAYMPKKQPQQQIQNQPQLPHYPPKIKRPPQPQPHKNRGPPKHLPHRSSSGSSSKFTQVTKEQEYLVANLPDIINREEDSDEETTNTRHTHHSQSEPQKKEELQVKLKQINESMVKKMYQDMLQSQRSTTQNQPTTQNSTSSQPQQQQQYAENTQNIEQMIPETSEPYNHYQSDNYDEQQNGIVEEEEGEGEQNYNQGYESSQQQGTHNQWEYDEEPQLPMLEETETPLFEEANPYLVQEDEEYQKTEEQILEDKKQHLQIKLKQNMKREDQINKLMQLKIEQCRNAVPSSFQQILDFFRRKINMDRQYTEDDEREVQTFLARKGLTDQRKFQNIYKIMHFQMELENTRRIIQSLCKKLNELDRDRDRDR